MAKKKSAPPAAKDEQINDPVPADSGEIEPAEEADQKVDWNDARGRDPVSEGFEGQGLDLSVYGKRVDD